MQKSGWRFKWLPQSSNLSSMRKDKESILSTSTFSMVSGSCVRSRSNACFCMRTLSRGLMVTCRRYLRSTFILLVACLLCDLMVIISVQMVDTTELEMKRPAMRETIINTFRTNGRTARRTMV